MHFTTIISALALAATVAGAPTANRASSQRRDASDFDKPMCYWKSAEGFYVTWAITVPQYDGKSVQTIKNDFKGSIDKNSACRGITAAPVKGSKEWWTVGAQNTTALFTFDSSDFCTAYQMTKVIKATTGNVQSTACVKWDDAEDGGPDASNLITEIPEDGDDGEDGTFKRMVLNRKRSASKRDGSQPMSDQDMAKLLGLPENTPHDQLVAKLNGPSPLDNQQ